MFVWLMFGFVGAYATYFMNRFRIFFFFACLCGLLLLDLIVIIIVIVFVVGMDKENL